MKRNSFKPAWWLPNAHFQTLFPTLCRRPIKSLPLKRERLELPDGDFVDLDWVDEEERPIVVILHGLEGSINSPYAKGMLRAIHARGWRGVFMHFRGCSGEANRKPHSYHSGCTEDFDMVLQILHKRAPHVPISAIGFSLGGNVLLKWLGEAGHQDLLAAAVAISVPFELQDATRRIQKGFSRLYQWHFLRSLRKKLGKKFRNQSAPFDVSLLGALKTLQEFDDKITAPMHGFANANDYYIKTSSNRFLNRIETPTLLVQAKDDPFLSPSFLPNAQELPSCVTLELTENGGHVGFVSGPTPWRPHYWLEQRVPEYLASHF